MAQSRARRASRRRLLQGAAGSAALGIGFPMLNFASFRLFADTPATYSARAVALVERSLVIDMLAPLKIDFLPEAYANPLTEAEIIAFARARMGGAFSWEEVKRYRDAWKGPMALKGILHPADAKKALAMVLDLDQVPVRGRLRQPEHRPVVNPGMTRHDSVGLARL